LQTTLKFEQETWPVTWRIDFIQS